MEIGLSPNFDITGTKWYHKTGKDSFVVREVIMDPSQGMIVLAEDGRTFSMDAMDNYIQTNEPFNAPQYSTPPVDLRGLDKETPIYIETPTSTTIPQSEDPSIQTPLMSPQQPEHSETYRIIDRALSNIEPPSIQFTISQKVPTVVATLLMEVMNIEAEEIAEYYYDKFLCDHTALKEEFIRQIADSLIGEPVDPKC